MKLVRSEAGLGWLEVMSESSSPSQGYRMDHHWLAVERREADREKDDQRKTLQDLSRKLELKEDGFECFQWVF